MMRDPCEEPAGLLILSHGEGRRALLEEEGKSPPGFHFSQFGL